MTKLKLELLAIIAVTLLATIGTAYALITHADSVIIDNKLDIGNSGIASDWGSLTIHHTSTSGGGYFVQLDGNGPFVGVNGFDHPPSNRRILYLGGGNWGVDDANEILFWTDPTYTGGINEGVKRVTIDSVGNFGIGLIPAERLDVDGNIRLTGNIVSPNDICIGNCP